MVRPVLCAVPPEQAVRAGGGNLKGVGRSPAQCPWGPRQADEQVGGSLNSLELPWGKLLYGMFPHYTAPSA